MKIDRIVIAGCRLDARWTQCAVASIRRWYPEIPIALAKDLHHGSYDTSELERYWRVSLAALPHADFGWGMSKFDLMSDKSGDRIVLLDSDVIFRGPILSQWEQFDEDIIVDNTTQPESNIDLFYFNLDRLRTLDPDWVFPGHIFNSGVLVLTTGLCHRADFEPFIDFTPPPKLRDRHTFRGRNQGVLNYLFFKWQQEGRITLARTKMQDWSGYVPPTRGAKYRRDHAKLLDGSVLHYAGLKHTLFSANRNAHLLHYWEAEYYARIPGGAARRRRDRLRRGLNVLMKREPWTQYL